MRVKLKRQRLLEALSRSSLTQNHWAMKLGFSRGHFSEIVNGKHPYVSPRTREKLLEGLNIPFEELFEVEEGDAWTHQSSADFQAAIVDRYLIDQELGHGGMGTVYLARDVKLGRQVAVKVISPEVVSGVGAKQFLKEIRHTARLDHPNIPTLLDADMAAGYPYYVMPFVRGGSLKDLIRRKGRLSLDETLGVIRDVAAALEFAHENRVIHCDIKPANILLAGTHAYLADFGISRVVHAETREWGRRGEIDSSAGTPAYVSPEQASGETDLDARTDIYSLGCVTYEMLTGEPPFAGTTTMETVAKRFTAVVPNAREVVPEIPAEVASVIERSMAILGRRRHQTALEFVEALSRAAQRSHRVIERVAVAWSSLRRGFRRLTGRASLASYTTRRRVWHMDRATNDLRFALRSLRKHPGFTTVALLTLALGVGANTAIFSIINGVFLRTPAMEDPQSLAEVHRRYPDGNYYYLSHRDVNDLRDQAADLFTGVTSYKWATGQIGGGAGPGDIVMVELVNANYFDLHGVRMVVGRTFLPEEDLTPETHPVIVLSYRYWSNAFGKDPAVVGTSLRLNGRPYTVVGVVEEAFPGRVMAPLPDAWVPMQMENHLYPSGIDNNNLGVSVRLRPGVTAPQAVAMLKALSAGIDADRGRTNRRWDFDVVSYDEVTLHPELDKPIKAMAALLTAVVAIVLLITCTNLASFLLARATDRRKEIAVRLALGATRGTLVRQLLTESLLLGLAGGVLGLVVAVWVDGILLSLKPPLPFVIHLDVGVDFRVLLFTFGIAALAGVLFGLAPALQGTRTEVAPVLRDESGGVARGGRLNLRSTLVVGQVAMSLVLLIGAGLFIRSFQAALHVDLGFSTEPAAIVSVDARGSGYDADEYMELGQRLSDAARRVPGVTQVSISNRLPLALGNDSWSVRIPGVELPNGREQVFVEDAGVSEDYFDVFGIPILHGRAFTAFDDSTSQSVAIISNAFAQRYWPDESPVGRTIVLGGAGQTVIVGVAADAKVKTLNESPQAFLYVPIRQHQMPTITIVAKGTAPVQELVQSLRARVLSIDPGLFITQSITLNDHIGVLYYLPKMAAALISIFAALAIALACVGLYGVVSYAVARRTREMGIRISLGAQAGHVIRLVLMSGLGLVAVGGVIGLVLSLAVARLLEGFLMGVGGTDLVTFAVVPLLLAAVALLAAYLPARRASRVSPMEALRTE